MRRAARARLPIRVRLNRKRARRVWLSNSPIGRTEHVQSIEAQAAYWQTFAGDASTVKYAEIILLPWLDAIATLRGEPVTQ